MLCGKAEMATVVVDRRCSKGRFGTSDQVAKLTASLLSRERSSSLLRGGAAGRHELESRIAAKHGESLEATLVHSYRVNGVR